MPKQYLKKLYPSLHTQEDRIPDPAEAAADSLMKARRRGDLKDIEKKGAKLTDEIVDQEKGLVAAKEDSDKLEKKLKK